VIFPGLLHPIVPGPSTFVPVPALLGPLVAEPPEGQDVEDVNAPVPPWQIVTPVVVGTGFTVTVIVLTAAVQDPEPSGSSVVNVNTTVPLEMLGV
jgi:hypothetical protein